MKIKIMNLHGGEAPTYAAGASARNSGEPKSANPHAKGLDRWLWAFGWITRDGDLRRKAEAPVTDKNKVDPTFARYGIVAR